jgi:acyl-CoA thioesterase-1
MNQLDSKNVKSRSQHFALQRRHCIAVALTLAISGACGAAVASSPARNKEPAKAAPGAKPGPVLVLGDSLSAEYGLTRGKGWVQLLQQRMNDEKIRARWSMPASAARPRPAAERAWRRCSGSMSRAS